MAIALLTDFGTRDYFVAAMKGVILSINPQAQIVDVTHEISPQDIRSAAFTLRSCYKDFPKRTIFAAVVDPGVGSDRKAILVDTNDYLFIAPDNGLLSLVMPNAASIYELTNEEFFNRPVSPKFHGRDIFAPVAAHLSNSIDPKEFGRKIEDFARLEIKKPRQISENEIEAEIIHIDRFGNLITNLERKDLQEFFYLEINGRTIQNYRRFYAEAEAGEIFSITGSTGFLEISAFQDSAKDLLNARTGQKISIKVETRR